MQLLARIRVIVALGKIAFDNVWNIASNPGRLRPRFRHGLEVELPSGLSLLASFHPSQQNTFTGKLTEPMFDSVFARARELLKEPSRNGLKSGR
jgi:uracil-DNA glycosylase